MQCFACFDDARRALNADAIGDYAGYPRLMPLELRSVVFNLVRSALNLPIETTNKANTDAKAANPDFLPREIKPLLTLSELYLVESSDM